MTDEKWVQIHEDFGHKVYADKYQCKTCGQRYEQYMDMTILEKHLWLIKYLPEA